MNIYRYSKTGFTMQVQYDFLDLVTFCLEPKIKHEETLSSHTISLIHHGKKTIIDMVTKYGLTELSCGISVFLCKPSFHDSRFLLNHLDTKTHHQWNQEHPECMWRWWSADIDPHAIGYSNAVRNSVQWLTEHESIEAYIPASQKHYITQITALDKLEYGEVV